MSLIRDELGGKIMKEFMKNEEFGLRARTFSYLTDDDSEDKKPKGTKKRVVKESLKFECREKNV